MNSKENVLELICILLLWWQIEFSDRMLIHKRCTRLRRDRSSKLPWRGLTVWHTALVDSPNGEFVIDLNGKSNR